MANGTWQQSAISSSIEPLGRSPARTLLAASILLLLICDAHGDPSSARPPAPDAQPFQGSFQGWIDGDSSSRASIYMNLSQSGRNISGWAELGSGLRVNTGGFLCPGTISVPASRFAVGGSVRDGQPGMLQASSQIPVSRRAVKVEISGDASSGDGSMRLDIRLNLPWPCRSSRLSASLSRLA
ncbi:MAG: hypothetical protein A4E45_00926 [Methanosaeta sp. PtaB.Bin039]|nr:MAG: hypothetical protein A4E45_00926 [Methanosaeta sp. PtaB.Bin039]OPY46190.1 MAG: hypothetical protein A4E47_00668 [Methanosaeta sp. PtaU1.Bin028]HOT06630.1 hypothetical protein [Methanotrichaceae archaeon]